MIDDIPEVRVYVDDVLIWDTTRQEHNERLKCALKSTEAAGLTINLAKCEFCAEKITFLGDIISTEEISLSQALVKSVRNMPKPQNKQAVQRLLGVVNYFSKHLPSLALQTPVLRGLLMRKQNVIFEWTANHEREWKDICDAFAKAPLLAIFDP